MKREVSLVIILGRSILGRGRCKCSSFKIELCLVCLRKSKKVDVIGIE